MIFLNCLRETIIQVSDKTRIDVSKSFIANSSPITNIKIEPDSGVGLITVFNTNQDKWFIDWAYATPGEKTVTVEATDGVNTISQTFKILVLSEADDFLYSNDEQIFMLESELKKYLSPGRNSYKNIHRESQTRILNFLDRKGIWQKTGDPFSKLQINLHGELSNWSLYESLFIIYTDLFISVGDKFAEKVNQYKELRNIERERSSIRIDKDGNGTIEAGTGEFQELRVTRMIKR